jgi:threonine dehydrogenase-like Zn-dependent dehydrogenase
VIATPRIGGLVVELRAERELAVVERAIPAPLSGEALVRLSAVGICGTDVHGYLGRIDTLPMTLGHDAVGVIEALGSIENTAFAVGDRVTIDPTIACGECAACLGGRSHLCIRGSYLGMTAPGAMTEYITVGIDRLVAVPDAVTDADATVLEPVAVALHLLDRIGAFRPRGMHAHVIGGGPLGVLLAQTLVAHGWNPVVHEPQDYRRTIAAAAGLEVADGTAIDAGTGEPVLIVETSASGAGIELARRIAVAGSVIALVGRAPAQFTSAEILLKELSILGVKSGVGQYAAALALVESGAVTPSITVTHEFGLAAASAAFEAVTDPAQRVMRAVLTVS